MTFRDAFLSLAIAVAAGALIGAEREQAHASHGRRDFGGVRTFPLVAMLGAVAALLAPSLGTWIVGAFLLAVVVVLAVSRVQGKNDDPGITSEIAAIVTFALGVVAGSPDLLPDVFLFVIGVAALTMVLLAVKRPLHGFIAKVSSDDVYATAKFVLLALVLIPLLPNRTYGPLDVLNPFKIGLMIALVAGVSFAGYVVARLIGSGRGLLLIGLVGGLVSSTAVTLTLAGRAKEEPALLRHCALGILAACSTMFARVLVIVGIVDRRLLPSLLVPLGAATVVSFAAAVFWLRRDSPKAKADAAVPLKNPFELGSAVKFGLIYAAILLVAKAAELYAGTKGLYASSVIAGLTDVDAITLSLADLHRSGTSGRVAAIGIFLAAMTNTLVKAVIAGVVGGRPLARRVSSALALALGGGALGLFVQDFFGGS